jgi:hypothetical protein
MIVPTYAGTTAEICPVEGSELIKEFRGESVGTHPGSCCAADDITQKRGKMTHAACPTVLRLKTHDNEASHRLETFD